MRRVLIGYLFVLHGLAHAALGTWAAHLAPPPVLTVLWATAMVGFIVAGFGLLGVAGMHRRWELAAAIATASSVMLFLAYGHLAFAVGLALDVGVLVIGLRWAEACDCAEPAVRRRRPRVRDVLAWGFVAWVAVVVVARPWYLNWGTTVAERIMALPGDGLVPDARYRMDHAVTVHAPADAVWPWVAQIGQDRGGFYSYDRLEGLVGARVRNADRVHPEWQRRDTGDLVRAVPADWMGGRFGRELGWRVAAVEPGRAMVLRNWGAFVVTPIDARSSRLHIRLRGPGTPSAISVVMAPLGLLVFEPAHFVMERRMLLGIKARAEHGVATQGA